MKVKVYPEDFVVSEVAEIEQSSSGEHTLYLLRKKNITTWDALGRLAKHLRLPLSRIGYGGLKDKRALSHQFITILHGPKKDLRFEDFELIFLGQTPHPMTQSKVIGNIFEITVRDTLLDDKTLAEEIKKVELFGIPNYFDEQRFGSIRDTAKLEFAAKCIIKGDYEKALFLAVATSSPDDIKKSRKLRDCLKKSWRRWEECLPLARLKWEKNLLEFLLKNKPSKRTFKRSLQLLDQEYLFFLGNVYQSYLWNEILKRVLTKLGLVDFKIPYSLGELYFYREGTPEKQEDLRELKIPLPAPKLSFKENKPFVVEALRETLEAEGFKELKDLRSLVKGLVFKSYPRPAIVYPKDLNFVRLGPREIKLRFFLEKGSYATLVVKRIFHACENA